jgi:hypothetical protein
MHSFISVRRKTPGISIAKSVVSRNAEFNTNNGGEDMENHIDSNVAVNEAPQMKVMGNAGGSRTTTGGNEPNTTLASRADQSLGAMGNAAGLPPAQNEMQEQKAISNPALPDITNMIRQYPIPSLLLGIGVGYLLFSRR